MDNRVIPRLLTGAAIAVALLGLGMPLLTSASVAPLGSGLDPASRNALSRLPLNQSTEALEAESPSSAASPWSEIGAEAGPNYDGDGLSIVPTENGASLQAIFQKLEGEATSEGLWLTSTVVEAKNDLFRVIASSVGRRGSDGSRTSLASTGAVTVNGDTANFIRPGVVEEYMVSMDGVRQDFVVMESPPGDGELRLDLEVSGGRAESAGYGARLVLDKSGRNIAYSRLYVVDAEGRELAARMEVPSPERLTVVVDDAEAVYPVRIDPTFSDENWISIGGVPGPDGAVLAAVVDGSGNLYIGGDFTAVGDVIASGVAKWDGDQWSALGGGLGGESAPSVAALAISGDDLYVGGDFTSAGGNNTNNVAKWDGSEWLTLGSGVGGRVSALAASGEDLYVGNFFMEAGGNAAYLVAKWNGSEWSTLGSGVDGRVSALAASGEDLYVGGFFWEAGGNAAYYLVAKWNGSDWSELGNMALGNIVGDEVRALAVLGDDLYVGGIFWEVEAGHSDAMRSIVKWNGSEWSAPASEASGEIIFPISALAVSGGDLYVGGSARMLVVDGSSIPKNRIAKWNGNEWSELGSVLNSGVSALATSGNDLYVGGWVERAGGQDSGYVAKVGLGEATEAPTPAISSVAPSSMPGSTELQTLTIDGSNFHSDATLTFDPPTGGTIESTEERFTSKSETQLEYSINNDNDAGTWRVRVNNPDGQLSGWASFTVGSGAQPPLVTGVEPSPVPGSSAEQWITLHGEHFEAGFTVTLIDVTNNTPNQPINDPARLNFIGEKQIQILGNVGEVEATWVVVVHNPDGQSSDWASFPVSAAVPEASYAEWVTGIENSAGQGAEYKKAEEGFPNLIRYAFGLDPEEPTPPDFVSYVIEGNGDFVVSFQRNALSGDCILTIERSVDLSNWEVIARGEGSAEMVAGEAGSVEIAQDLMADESSWSITIHDRSAASGTAGMFFRFRAELNSE